MIRCRSVLRSILAGSACLALPAVGAAQAAGTPTAHADTVTASGRWTLTVSTEGQSFPFWMTLTQDGSKVTGSGRNANGEGKISGTVEGDLLDVTLLLEEDGETFDIHLKGTIDGASIAGTATSGDRDYTFTGKREPETRPDGS